MGERTELSEEGGIHGLEGRLWERAEMSLEEAELV